MTGDGRRLFVSIVTPTYNRADLLRWTMASIRNQSFDNFEHIIVDGGSTDGTRELLHKAVGTYPMRWSSEPDEGMYQAINKGLAQARGDIVAYLNSDDLYFPWTLETVVAAFEANPDAHFVFGDVLAVDDATGEAQIYWMLPFDLDFIRRSGYLAQPGVFWRRRVLEELGPFDETLRYVADCDYWMRAGDRYRFLKIDEFLAVERLHHSTLRESVGEPLWKELERVRSSYVTLTGPHHDVQIAKHNDRRNRLERKYKVRLLLHSYTPRPLRKWPGGKILDSPFIRVRRFRYLLRVLLIGSFVPLLRRWTSRPLIRAERSLLEPH